MSAQKVHPVALLVDELIRLTPRVRNIFSDAAASSDLSRMDITVLTATVEAATPPTVPRIGRSLDHPRQVIQRSVNTLVAKGLIAVTSNPDHKRAPLLVPTELGRQAKASVDAKAKAGLDAILEILSPKLCAKLTHELRAARREIERFLKKEADADVRG